MNHIFLRFILLVLATTSIHFQASANQSYGIFMITKGIVKVQNPKSGTIDAKVGVKVFEGDTVTTGPDSRAKIVMSDRNVINVNPDTKLVISIYQNDSATGKKEVQLELLQGKVRNNVEQIYDGSKSKFLIKTPTAVAGVRGTQFLAGYDPKTQLTSIVTFKGAVSVASVNVQGQVVGAPVMVKKGEMTTAEPNAAPAAPKVLPKEDIKKMDVESAAVAQAPSENSGKKVADSDKEKKKEGDDKQPEQGDRAENKPDAKPENKNEAVADSKGEPKPEPKPEAGPAKREVANTEAPPPPPSAPTMIDKKDLGIGAVNEMRDMKAPSPVPFMPVQPPPRAPGTDSTQLTDIIRDNMGKTRVIVQPQLPPP